MGAFNNKNDEKIKNLQEDSKKLREKLSTIEISIKSIQIELNRKPESEATQIARKAAEYRNRTEDRLKEASVIVEQLQKELNDAKNINSKLSQEKSEIETYRNEILSIRQNFQLLEDNHQSAYQILNQKIEHLEEYFNEHPNLDVELLKADEFIKVLEENQKKSTLTLNSINKRKSEIDDIHREIFGYEEKNEDNEEVTKIEGLKDELEKTYDNLESNLTESFENLEILNDDYKKKFENFESAHKEAYTKIIDEIRGLLPNALTAGLSAAFSKKKEDEVISHEKLQQSFKNGIYLLLAVSLIPFLTGIYFLMQDEKFGDVILKMPRIVMAIIPMYIPVLWFTYSANKKMNLSKRLIEEYAHKEVLSRTYEGLSAQIDGVSDKAQSEELKFRLLSNFLQVSSENPGKLISNYEASDHPVMEALEQSYKFQIAIDKLEGIPGMSKVAAFLEKKAKKKIQDRIQKTEEVLSDESDE